MNTSPRLRRLLPTRLAVSRAEERGRRLWEESEEERERARAAMQAIVGGTARAGEAEALAPEHLIEGSVRETLFWQPWQPPELEETSSIRLRETLASGRGVLLSPTHMGPYLLCISAITALGRTPYSVSAPYAFDHLAPGYWGRRIARRRSQARARGERLIRSTGSFAVLKALLEEGELVSVFFTMPGRQETRFLGKRVMFASGSGRLGTETGALVLPVRARRVGHRVWLDVDEPLDSGSFADADELHEALAARHERWMLELPATSEDPNREGAWERGADAGAWLRPGS